MELTNYARNDLFGQRNCLLHILTEAICTMSFQSDDLDEHTAPIG
jgi:hypothetical protein